MTLNEDGSEYKQNLAKSKGMTSNLSRSSFNKSKNFGAQLNNYMDSNKFKSEIQSNSITESIGSDSESILMRVNDKKPS